MNTIRMLWKALLVAALLATACSEEEGGPPLGDDDTVGDDDVADDDDTSDDDDTAGDDCVDVWVSWLQEVDASTEIAVDWTALTVDAYGAPFDPLTDVTEVQYAFLRLTAEEAQQAICDASLVQSDLAAHYIEGCIDYWLDGIYLIDTSQYADHTLSVSLHTDGAFRSIAIADIVAGSANDVLVFEDGGAVAP